MSVEAPWLALACDWHESEMFSNTTAGQKLAFIAMLCFSKSRGRAGRFTLRASVMCREFSITEDDLSRMLTIAEEHGAITFDGSAVQFTNWAIYQDPAKRRANLVKRNGFSKSSTTGPKTRTKDPGQDQGPEPEPEPGQEEISSSDSSARPQGISDSASGPDSDPAMARLKGHIRYSQAVIPLIGRVDGSRHPSGSPQLMADETCVRQWWSEIIWPEDDDVDACAKRLATFIGWCSKASTRKKPMAWLTQMIKQQEKAVTG